MPNTILAALSSEEILQSKLSAVVTAEFVMVMSPKGVQIVISLDRLSEIKRIKTIFPGLLVLASGALLIAAAAYCSKEGDGAALPAALLGLSFVIAYFWSRRAVVAFIVDGESTETASGSLRDAEALVRAVQMVRSRHGYALAKRSEEGESSRQWMGRTLGFLRSKRA